jgi:hypothetical protein
VLATFVLVMSAAYTQKERYSDRVAELSRDVIGDENTARVESWYLSVQDRFDRLKYEVFGGSTNPFGEEHASVQSLLDPLVRVEVADLRPYGSPAVLQSAAALSLH